MDNLPVQGVESHGLLEGGSMGRILALLYGVVCYFVFFGTFLYLVWFVWSMSPTRPEAPLDRALLIDGGLVLLFAVQHSVMARRWFKNAWTKIVSPPVERSTYVLIASLVLLALMYFWQPVPSVIWEVSLPLGRWLLQGLFVVGWLVVLLSTFLIDHFELFGLKQVWTYWRQLPFRPPAFKTPLFYRFVRHPIYLGFLMALWFTPVMTADHLFFALTITAYILIAIQMEERDLIHFHGEDYKVYRSGVSMLVPWPSKRKPPSE